MISISARASGGNTRLWQKIRIRILQRDGYCCQYCGSESADTVDHVIPISKGGTDEDFNLVAACKRCNYSKSNRPSPFFGQGRTPLTLPFPLSQKNESKSHD